MKDKAAEKRFYRQKIDVHLEISYTKRPVSVTGGKFSSALTIYIYVKNIGTDPETRLNPTQHSGHGNDMYF